MSISSDNYGYWTWGDKCALWGGPSLEVEMADGRTVIQKYQGNPAIVEDYFIVNALNRSPKARTDFTRLLPTLDDVSQSRLTNLIKRNPVITRMMVAQTTRDDAIQHKEVTAGVHVRAGGKPGIT